MATEVVWDLSDLYSGVDDPRIEQDITWIKTKAEDFERKFKGKIAVRDLTASFLKQALDEYEEILRAEARPLSYASLLFTADTTDFRRGYLLQKMQEAGSAIRTHLIFFNLEIGRIPQEVFDRIISDPLLVPYRHYLQHQRSLASHYLTEPEEKILEETANTSYRSLHRLFEEVTSRQKYRVVWNGQVRELTQSEIFSLLYSPDRSLRKAAAEGFTEGLKANSHILHFIFNTLLYDKAIRDRLRKFTFPEEERHLANEIAPEVVEMVAELCVSHYFLVADYYRWKGRLLGLEELTHYDRYAPLTEKPVEISFDTARDIILEAFEGFSPEFRGLAEQFFLRRWIDAEVRPGKGGGAYCSAVAPDWHPYIFMNFTGKPKDVMTLAHELGHGIHNLLARGQNMLNFHPSLPMAETASVFGEMLVFDRLQETLENPKERLAVLAEKIEDIFATVFRQVGMYRFEQRVHRLRREQGELSVEAVNQLWQTTMQEMFQDALKLGEDHAWWWLYIPHLFESPFYVYAYAFGQLLVLALYVRYKQEGAPFVQRYLRLLSAGGSDTPAQLLKEVEIDISDRSFWEGGLSLVQEMVEQAKGLVDRVSPSGFGGRTL